MADYSRLCLAYPKGDEPAARMFTDARGIHRAAMANTPLLLHEVLDTVGISLHDIDHVITHQTSGTARYARGWPRRRHTSERAPGTMP